VLFPKSSRVLGGVAVNDGVDQNILRDPEQMSAHFLQTVFAGQDTGFLSLFNKPSNRATFVSLATATWHTVAAKAAVQARDRENAYFAIGVQRRRPEQGRGKQDAVIAVPGVWGDIDVLGPNHVAPNLPPTENDAWNIVRAIPFKPTIVVRTGGGLQAFWLFKEPLETTTEESRLVAKQLSKRFQQLLRAIASRNGWGLDNTSDLCRLLRIPGTFNRKFEAPVLVTFEVIDDGPRCNPSEIADLVEEIKTDEHRKTYVHGASSGNSKTEFLPILEGCSWIRHCKDDAATLSEPQWYGALSIVGRCVDGDRIAHDLSKPYPKYSVEETEKKLRQALGAAGPATCAFIENELGQSKYCSTCVHLGRIQSPIVLGIRKAIGHAQPRHAEFPTIQTINRQLRDISREALNALRAYNTPPSFFARGGRAVCVVREDSGQCRIAEMSDLILRNRLTMSANFYKVSDKGAVVGCAPPMSVPRDILAMPPMDWGFPVLQGLIESPALREDGTLITSAGYDAASRLFYANNPGLILPQISTRHTSDDIQQALEVILDVLFDFPFVDGASRANTIAAMLTPICRPAIKGPTPLALFDATSQGTGKTLLAEIISLITIGREGTLFSAPRDADEWRKQITSVLRDGSPIVIIDNVINRLESADLCKALTETNHGDRILGQSQTINLPVRCAWIATGNNIQLGGDMPRRCYWIRMDAGCAKPFERTGFRHHRLKQYVLLRRGELLRALLVLARSWFIAGCPESDQVPIGSFEDWTTVLGGILQHAGIDGFLANSGELYKAADAESIQWENFLKTLNDIVFAEPFTVSQVWERMNLRSYRLGIQQNALTDSADRLRAAIPDFLAIAMDREGLFKQRLGVAFRERVGRRFGDAQFRIVRCEDDLHAKVARWRIAQNLAV
jgi:hypothetical protein